jgi:hypothetical protein
MVKKPSSIYPAYHSKVFKTKKGIFYLKEPGVVLVSQSIPDLSGVGGFLQGFDKKL